MRRNTCIFLSLLGLPPFFNRRHNLVAVSRLCYIRSPLLFIIFLLAIPAQAARTDIAGPAGGGSFGSSVTVLPNGNFVVQDSSLSIPGAANVGAVYLYDGATLKIISKLTGSAANDQVGSFGIAVLANGNYVVRSLGWHNVGAVTWCSATTGCDGLVSASNSLVGGTPEDRIGNAGITALTNGNYVVTSDQWDNPDGPMVDAGAVTWGNGKEGTVGLITPNNSLVGTWPFDNLGGFGFGGGEGYVVALTNGNYVVKSPGWSIPKGNEHVGEVTWGNGNSGTAGAITSSNSLIGSTTGDFAATNITALTNGNYVVSSRSWDNRAEGKVDVGAVTWGNGNGGTVGLITSSNSLIGGTANDAVGYGGVTALTNGNYVILSAVWNNPTGPLAVGAVTWGNGRGGTVGLISTSNSLFGGSKDDLQDAFVTALTNGNYVVSSNWWDNPTGPFTDAGAVTWGNGNGGTVGLITSGNSLVGGRPGDRVGIPSFGRQTVGVTPLTNGNYVVSSPWWSNVGAVTWGDGTKGTVGLVSSNNSLIGGTAADQIGLGGITPLNNGNYVVSSPYWDNPAGPIANVGASTWGNGTKGTFGLVSSSNSLIGSSPNDYVGGDSFGSPIEGEGEVYEVNRLGATALANGNYVVESSHWDDPTRSLVNVGAVTWGNGSTGTVGVVSSSNSLVGGTANDNVGDEGPYSGNDVMSLSNGNYVVTIPRWDNPTGKLPDAGAVTWGNGNGGTVGLITLTNSLIGGTAFDDVGSGNVTVLPNGNYVINSLAWDNPNGPIVDAGAVTLGNGVNGTTGLITATNSVTGAVSKDLGTFSYDATRNRLFVGRPGSNIVTVFFFETTAIADGALDNAATWNNGVPNALVNAVIPTGRTVTVNSAATIGSLSIANGGTLTMNANLNLTGVLTLGGKISTGANTLGLSCSTSVFGASSSNYIIGTVRKDFCATGAFDFPVGTTNGFSPVTTNVTALTVNPSSLTVKAVEGVQPNLPESSLALQRYWTLTASGISADLTFNYLDSDVPGTVSEGALAIFKYDGSFSMPGGLVNTALNQAKITGVNTFSDWTLAQPTPNQIDNGQFFVRQHYLDFLNREPDAAGLAFWTNEITSCGSDAQCIEVKRINVSAAFFLSIEFQQSGYLVYRFYKSSFGNLPTSPLPIRLSEFLSGAQQIGQGVIVGQAGWETVLENNKQTFASQFVQGSRFTSAYPTSLSPAQFVDALFANAGVVPSTGDRAVAINEFGAASTTSEVAARARALRRVAENSILAQQEFNRAFVLMQYFGYLRRNPNDPPEATLDFQGYNFWLNKLNAFNGNFIQAEMVKSFIDSSEYRQRFGP